MKKEYEKMIWTIRDDMKKVPLSVKGHRTSFIDSYIHTCKDLEVEHENLVCFFDYLQQTVFWEEKYKKADKWDKEEIMGTIEYVKEKMHHYFKEYHSWVEERVKEQWK